VTSVWERCRDFILSSLLTMGGSCTCFQNENSALVELVFVGLYIQLSTMCSLFTTEYFFLWVLGNVTSVNKKSQTASIVERKLMLHISITLRCLVFIIGCAVFNHCCVIK